ncbi:MAG: ABC transporter substrate-binding protein [SAR324 cluster bacterium]|nr:ABC transporter substrate-binding protein [SAR324 cluster bacterium]
MPTRTPHRRPARTSRWIALPLAAAFLAAVLLAAIAGGACSKREEGSRQRTVSTTAGAASAALGEHVRGNPEAPVGGVRRSHFGVQPHTLHPINATDVYGNQILGLIYEDLTTLDVDTLEHLPVIAKRWEISADNKVFTFYIDPEARWQDGKPVTAEDVKFSFDVLFHEKLKYRAKWMSYYGNVEKAEVVDPRTVRFTVKNDHFHNFINVASLRILPKHGFDPDDPNETVLAKEPMGSGPYRFSEWKKGNSISLRRHGAYWGAGLPQNLGRHNQELLLFKVIPTDKVALESFKKGDLEFLGLTPEQWVKETSGEEFGEGIDSGARLIKLDVQNRAPRSYSYVGYNPESPYFGDKRVRRAMSHLFDRDEIIDKFFHGLRDKAVGPFEVNSRYSSAKVEAIEFSIPKAIGLLEEAGWRDTDDDQIVDKDGRPFRFTVMLADASEVGLKVLTLTKENMRKAGVVLEIKPVDWTSLLQLIDELKYDAVMLGWSRGQFPDPTALWHSKNAMAGGLNLVRYRNPEVDKLIDAGVKTIPDEERIELFRRVHQLIFDDQPYTFLVETSHTLIGFNSKFGMVKAWYNYDLGTSYWWVSEL